MASYPLVCKKCGKNFTHHNKADIRMGRMKYCSTECCKRKLNFKFDYFDERPLPKHKLVTLGQIIATTHIYDGRMVSIISDIPTLKDISKELEYDHPFRGSSFGLSRLDITSKRLKESLYELGLSPNYLFQEVPPLDILDGLLKTHCYSILEDGRRIFRTNRSKIALYIRDVFDGEIVTHTYKDVGRGGTLSCDYIVVF